MKGSLGLGIYAGIPLKLHWTFGLIIIYVIYISTQEGFNIFRIVFSLLMIFSLFGCVVLHEYGHSITARRFGVKTKDIILTPIGGLARLSHIPIIPMQELVIAVAGPMVNLIIVFICLILFIPAFGWPGFTGFLKLVNEAPNNLLEFSLAIFCVMNAIILLFNMLPAFPMDGGRVFRALLAMKMDRVRATQIASYLGQLMSVGFLIWGTYNNQITLAFIGIFIFVSARAEYKSVKLTEKINSTPIDDLLTPNGQMRLQADQLLSDIGDYPSGDYAIVNRQNEPVGLLLENQLNKARQLGFLNQSLSQLMYPLVERLESHISVQDATAIFKRGNHYVLPVMKGHQFLGLLSRIDIQNFLNNLKV